MVLALIMHYSVYLGMALYGDPEHEVSVGLHEKIGPCNEKMELQTLFTLVTGEVRSCQFSYLFLETAQKLTAGLRRLGVGVNICVPLITTRNILISGA